jgi:hypothetical protein
MWEEQMLADVKPALDKYRSAVWLKRWARSDADFNRGKTRHGAQRMASPFIASMEDAIDATHRPTFGRRVRRQAGSYALKEQFGID